MHTQMDINRTDNGAIIAGYLHTVVSSSEDCKVTATTHSRAVTEKYMLAVQF